MYTMKLHLGCGNDKRNEYINCDISQYVNPDMIVDLEKPLLFEDNSLDEVLANHVFEHITNFIPLMHELYRICKKDTYIYIRVPFYSTWGQFNDPTHVRFFTPFTFNYFLKGTYSHEVGANLDMFNVETVKINFGIGTSRKMNWLFNPIINLNHKIYCRFFSYILPSAEIYFKLKVIK